MNEGCRTSSTTSGLTPTLGLTLLRLELSIAYSLARRSKTREGTKFSKTAVSKMRQGHYVQARQGERRFSGET